MSSTDHPLKQLFTSDIEELAAWLLQANVRDVSSRNIELPPSSEPVFSDLLFFVTLEDGRVAILHIEFQGRHTHRPMRFRLLDYLSRIILTYPEYLVISVVVYIGQGVGKRDTGMHRVTQPDGSICMEWHYKVLRLWEMDAETLLEMDNPALLPLVGQMRMQEPAKVLPQVVQRLHAVEDAQQRKQRLSLLVTLIEDREVLDIMTQLIERKELLLDTPFLRDIRQEGLEEGLEKGLSRLVEERKKALEQGIEQGELRTRRNSIVETLQVRFNLSEEACQQLASRLEAISDEQQLHTLFRQALLAADMDAFQAVWNGKGNMHNGA